MKKRLILPFVTLGIASAMVAGGLLTQPRAIEAEPGAGGAVPSKSRQVTTASSISSTGASSTDAPSSPATTGGEPSAETGASAELAVNEQSSSGNSPSEQSSPDQQSSPDAPETPLKTFQTRLSTVSPRRRLTAGTSTTSTASMRRSSRPSGNATAGATPTSDMARWA